MQNLVSVGRSLGKTVIDSIDTRNHCQLLFQYFCTTSCLTIVCGTLADQNVLKVSQAILLGVLLILPTQFLFYLIYKNWVSRSLQAHRWNEYSFWRGLQLLSILVLLFWLFPLALLSIAWQLFGIVTV